MDNRERAALDDPRVDAQIILAHWYDGKRKLTHNETEILIFALANESERRGGFAEGAKRLLAQWERLR